jgi:hypothetical protein
VKLFRALLDPLLAKAGYRLARMQPKGFPVELDAADREIVAHVAGRELSMGTAERLFATAMACRYVCEHAIDGDFIECGVWRGGHALIAADVFRRLAPQRKVWLFDTFAGMTEPTANDVTSGGEAAADLYHEGWCYASLEEVQAHFRARGLLPQAIFVKGDVAQTLRDAARLPTRIGVLRLDTDWYESTRLELEVLYPLLGRGGVLMVDDYGYWGGSRQAVDEYFGAHPRPFFHYVDHTARTAIKA